MPCHFDYKKSEDYSEDVGSETGIEAEPEYRILPRQELLEQTLYDLWLMMGETVCDAISAHLDSKLTEFGINHNVKYEKEPETAE